MQEIVPRLPQEQANAISNKNKIELVFLGFWFIVLVKNFINKEEKQQQANT